MSSRNQPRFDRSAWLHLVLMLFLVSFAIASTMYRFTLPTDGWLASEPESFNASGYIYQKNIMGMASGLQPGDYVVAVEGLPVAGGFDVNWVVRNAWQAGETVQYTVLRGGQELQINIHLVKWDLWSFLRNGGMTATSLVLWLGFAVFAAIGFLAFWRRPDEPAARALGVLSVVWLSVATVLSLLPPMLPEIIDPLASISTAILITATFTILGPPAFIRFALVFPKPKPSVQRHPWIAYLPFGVGVIGIGAFLAEFFVFGFAWTGLSVLIAILILIHNAFTMRDAVSRAQLRWGLGGMIAGLGMFFLTYIPVFSNLPGPVENIINAISAFSFGVMGLSLGIAVLRYRLWDIDVIIRKTLVYGLVTGLLAVVYFGGVLLLQEMFASLGTGQSPASLVLSTLLIAALFNPLRRKVQEAVDRRFYRRKYDAEKVMAAFTTAARDEVDIERLSAALVGAVEETVQPEYSSLWIRLGHGASKEARSE